jgi:hypothetical protein
MKLTGFLLLAAAVQARISGTATHNGDQDIFDNLMTDTSTTLQGGAKQVPLIHLSHDWVTQALIHAPALTSPPPDRSTAAITRSTRTVTPTKRASLPPTGTARSCRPRGTPMLPVCSGTRRILAPATRRGSPLPSWLRLPKRHFGTPPACPSKCDIRTTSPCQRVLQSAAPTSEALTYFGSLSFHRDAEYMPPTIRPTELIQLQFISQCECAELWFSRLLLARRVMYRVRMHVCCMPHTAARAQANPHRRVMQLQCGTERQSSSPMTELFQR